MRGDPHRGYYDFHSAITQAKRDLRTYGALVDPGRWQGVPTEGKPDLQTIEVLNWQCCVPVPGTVPELQHQIQPNLPWADDHFGERVSRVPSNPGEAYKTWPWWQGQEALTNAVATTTLDEGCSECESFEWFSDEDGYGHILHKPSCSFYESMPIFKFTHTYQERFWPKMVDREIQARMGIRYTYGDLDDLIALLLREPYTRQAYLPIFFPEDTGAVHGGRIPCTLGYHLMLRDGKLHMWYAIRSCDFVRHFRDDLYLACRLLLWVLNELTFYSDGEDQTWPNAVLGNLYFTAYSLHYHRGDEHLVK